MAWYLRRRSRRVQSLELLERAVIVALGELQHGPARTAKLAVVVARKHLVSGLAGVFLNGSRIVRGGIVLAEARLQERDHTELHGPTVGRSPGSKGGSVSLPSSPRTSAIVRLPVADS